MPYLFGEIRAFTGAEVYRFQAEIVRIEAVVNRKADDLWRLQLNPVNYVLETQRDAMTRLSNGLQQDRNILAQLKDSKDATIESGDTDKADRWFALAALIGGPGDMAVWNENVNFAKTSEMVTTVGGETARDVVGAVKNPFGVPLWVWGAGVVGLALLLRRR